MTFGSTLEARSSKLSAHAPPPLLFKWVGCCGWVSPWNYPFFRICSVLYAFFPLGFYVFFTISPSFLGYFSFELLSGIIFLMSCAPHGLLFFTIVLVASLLGFSAKNKRKRKEKGADLFFVSGSDVFRLPSFVVWFSRSPELAFFSHPFGFWVRRGECEEFPSWEPKRQECERSGFYPFDFASQ